MPKGIPVATVAIDNAMNAGLLAIRILGAQNDEIADRLDSYHAEMADESRKKTENLR
jgi:5-(carboxyamino)imidazole ribonucleotide mutase